MSDERLREAERKWKETGSVDDEARYLLERVRAGDLTQERLELAAYCGHEAAVAATGQAPFVGEPKDWALGLARFGKAACVRAAVAMAEAAVAQLSFPDEYLLRPLKLARNWLMGAESSETCAAAARELNRMSSPIMALNDGVYSWEAGTVLDATSDAAGAAGWPDAASCSAHAYGATLAAGRLCSPAQLTAAVGQVGRGRLGEVRTVQFCGEDCSVLWRGSPDASGPVP